MERKYGATQAIRDFITDMPYSDAFTVDDVMRATNHAFPRASVRAILHDQIGFNDLKQYDSGIWYRARHNAILGKDVPPNLTTLIPSLWLFDQNGMRIGYETGAFFANKLNLSTQIPANIDIATMRPNRKPSIARAIGVRLLVPGATVTSSNWRYLQILDMLASNPNADNDRNGHRLAQYLQDEQFSYVELMLLAHLHYPKRVQTALIQLTERLSDHADPH